MWDSLTTMSLEWYELVIRTIIVYFVLLILLRVTGNRQTGEMSPFDLILLLLISETMQSSMIGDDKSALGGLLAGSTLIGVNWLVGLISYRNKTISKLVEGSPSILIYHGKVIQKTLDEGRISSQEFHEALRQEGCISPTEVKLGVVETTGKISIIKYKDEVEKKKDQGG